MNYKLIKYLTFINLCLLQQSTTLSINLKNIFSPSKAQEEILNKEFNLEDNSKIELKNFNGNINIKTWNQNKALITAIKEGSKKATIDIRTYENTIDIITKNEKNNNKTTIHYNLMVPANTNIRIIMHNGYLKAKDIKGKIYIKLNSGNVEILDASNSIYVNITNNGSIKTQYNQVLPEIATTLKTRKGDININLPKEANADIEAKTENGTATSDHYITLKPQTMKLDNQAWGKFKKEINGTIGKGNSNIQLNTKNGNIKILEN